MKIRNFIINLTVLFALVGCFENKGNYNYVVLPDITVRLAGGSAIIIGEKNTYAPTFTFPEGYSTSFDYEWKINNIVVGKDEKYEFEAVEIGEFEIGVTVTDKKTGAKYFKYATQYVKSQFETGFLILTEDGENTEMHFLRSSIIEEDYNLKTNDTMIFKSEELNIYKNFIGEAIIGKPVKVTEHWTWRGSIDGELTVETIVDGKRKFSEYNGLTMMKETNIEQEFSSNGLPDNFAPKQVSHTCWDSFIFNENGYIYPRRLATSTSFHTGYFDKNNVLWGGAKFSDLFFCLYGNANAILAIEIDPITQERNFVGIYENIGSENFETVSSKKLPQKPMHPDFSNVKGDFIYDDFFKNGNKKETLHAFILKKENQYILQIAKFVNVNKLNLKFTGSIKCNLTTQYGISNVKGMFTSKTVSDKIVYFYDDHNVYFFDGLSEEFGIVISYPSKTIVAGAGHSNVTRDNNDDDYNKNQIEAHIMVGFEDGTIDLLELDNIEPTKVTKKILESNINFGPIKQIIYKTGGSLSNR